MSPRTPDPSTNPVTLGELFARGVPIAWPEAVAIVGELCSVVSSIGEAAAIPPAASIAIDASGAVVLIPGAAGTREVSALGRLLHQLLSTSNPPAPLRLFVSVATSSERYPSIQAFAEALAYYERPGRAELIGEVYQRFVATPADRPRPAIEPLLEELAAPPPPQPRSKRARAIVAVAATLAAGAVVAFAYLASSGAASRPAAFDRLVSTARAVAEETGVRLRGVFGVTSSLEDAPAAAEPIEPARPPRRVRARTVKPLVGVGVDAAVLMAPMPAPQNDSVFARAESADVDEADAAIPPALAIVDVDATYSNEAEDVEPPALLYPQIPPPLSQVPTTAVVNSFELIIGPQGHVERVRLIAGPWRMADVMLLSNAKTWRFQPALKDGQAVRYRLVLNWPVDQ